MGLGGIAALLVAAAGTAVAGAATAADHPGRAPYLQYCASCHGAGADGKGPVAASLRQPPADLRLLARKHGLPLPKPKLEEFVDGRDMVRAHGSREMPVWGERLLRDVPPSPGGEPFKRGTIRGILDYLESIQTPPPSP
jgi:mono/diheme cytochrome c family protein